ncbi:hypothetical protein A1O7_06104 [Cladophialophora yegresii CBS 114405]|uniref:HMG box domain-containing protein n=1 Tax=Cladophialophora yegresii CBS 114405 TaxID=1182544 RepID=W9W2D4_9EURO|nr:uncharacterized protein A1O7_06104 [Cladophialophora yegresii CBS 114405]EXJ58676.1 hypothetical protein A1O7_06104 [Cladophialophora yegresii CBS 114405]
MAQESTTARPPSPPRSPDGHYGQAADDQVPAPPTIKPQPYTPPMPASSFMSDMTSQPAYDPYGDPSLYHTAPAPIYYAPQQTLVTSVPSHTPPQNIGVLTRSGRAIGTPSSPATTESSRASQSPKSRRNLRKKASNKKGGPVIEQPLSLLTKDYKTPMRDMGLWVHRSVEERLAEVEKKKGYVSRPMNSFMLYRSAYAERVKQFCKENNHQVVSQVTGASWPLEPKEIRELYEQYAIAERDNHAIAHPNYKFAPNKAGKRTRNDDDSDSDPEWEGSVKGSKRSRSARRFESRSASSTPFDDRPAVYHRTMPAQHHLSGYEMSNPYGQPQIMFSSNGMVGDYFQTAATVGPYEQVADLAYRRIEEPFPGYPTSMGLVGLPHTEHRDLLTTYAAPQPMAISVQNDMLDPRLGQVDANYQVVYYEEGAEPGQEIPRTIAYDSGLKLDMGYEPESYHLGLATLTGEHGAWADSGQAGSDFEAEFQRMT